MARLLGQLQALITRFKPVLRWLVIGSTLFFVVATLRRHWSEVLAVHMQPTGGAYVAIALGLMILAQASAGWVWAAILQGFYPQIALTQLMAIYARTNLAKYLPGNVWHFYGRIRAAQRLGVPLSVAALGVGLEPLLMATAGLMLASIGYFHLIGWWTLTLIPVLCALHPRLINGGLRVLQKLSLERLRRRATAEALDDRRLEATVQLPHYPWAPLLGELAFVGLRGLGFTLLLAALAPVPWLQAPAIVGAFSLAWLVGFLVPGAPGGVGVFEAIALGLLSPTFPTGVVLALVGIHRVVSILAELLTAALVSGDEAINSHLRQWPDSPDSLPSSALDVAGDRGS